MAEGGGGGGSDGRISGEERTCELCGAPGDLTCPKCQRSFYCGPKHYRGHRRAHRENCYPVEEVMGPNRRNSLQATKQMEMGEVILKEIPLYIGPGSYDYCFKHHSQRDIPVRAICLGCYQFLPEEFRQTCSYCKWPMHKNCQDEPWHKDFECPIMANRKVKFSTTEPTQYYHISLLRLLLLPLILPDVWAKLRPMIQLHAEEMEQELGLGKMDSLAQCVTYKFGLSFQVNGVVLGGIYKTLQFKGIYHVMPDDVCCTCIFDRMSVIEHNCMPNTRYTMVPYKLGQPFQILLYASTEIPKGTTLTRNLTSEVTMQETFVRREKLRMICGYVCNCARCVDGTELSTFISAVCCPHPPCHSLHESYLLPQRPTDISLNTTWKCPHCQYTTTYGELQTFVDAEIKKIISIKLTVSPWRRNEEHLVDPDLRVYEVILDGIEMVLAHSELIVHPNHYVLWPLKDAYMNLVAQALDVMPMELKLHFSEKLISLARSIMSVVLVLSPGMSPITGRMLYYMAKGLESLLDTAGDLQDEQMNIRGVLDRLYRDSFTMLSLIKRFPQAHGVPMAQEMMEELVEGMEELKFDGVQRLFSTAEEAGTA